jgi:hypothetical protein
VQRWKEKDNLNLLMKCKDGKKKNRVVRGGGERMDGNFKIGSKILLRYLTL